MNFNIKDTTMDKQEYMELTDYAKENENGDDFSFFPGADPWHAADRLCEMQEEHLDQCRRIEQYNQLCNCNALRGIRHILRKEYGEKPVTVITFFKILQGNGYLSEEFLSSTFSLTMNDVRRGLEKGIVPPSVKITLSQFFNIQ